MNAAETQYGPDLCKMVPMVLSKNSIPILWITEGLGAHGFWPGRIVTNQMLVIKVN